MPPLKDLTGKQFGKLTVLGRDYNRTDAAYWICRCECGNIKSIKGYSLTHGITKSCGCRNPQHYKKCPVCGKIFPCPPSAKTITCSKECSLKHMSVTHKHPKSVVAKAKLSQTKKLQGKPKHYDVFVKANQKSEKCQRGEKHSAAKKWTIKFIETGDIYSFTNLTEFIRNHPELFDATDDKSVERVAHGFYTIKRNLLHGKNCITYKGWQIISFDDRKNCERDYK